MYPEEIERALLQHPAVREAAVVGVPHPVLGEVPVALLVTERETTATELAGHCRNLLSAAKVPVAFHRTESLPRTSAGKIRRADLPQLLPD